MNHADDTWQGTGDNPRWDASASATDPQAVATTAQDHAAQMRLHMLGFESGISTLAPDIRARNRARFAPFYYDLHRATLASDPKNAKHHVATMKVAEKIATQHPASLEAALSLCAGLATTEDIAEQYMLYKHSLLSANLRHWPDRGASLKDAVTFGLTPRSHDEKDLAALDQRLNEVYGDHTRSPWLARVGFAHAPEKALLRGSTAYPSGDMLLGKVPGKDEKTYHDNGKTMVEEMAHSMLLRHMQKERDSYNRWVKNRTALQTDKKAHLATHGFGMMLPERGDYTEELAHTMAHGLFDKPSMDPESREAPSDDSVAFASRLFRRQPKIMASAFRSFPN